MKDKLKEKEIEDKGSDISNTVIPTNNVGNTAKECCSPEEKKVCKEELIASLKDDDFWLRHTLGLGTFQIEKLLKRLNELI